MSAIWIIDDLLTVAEAKSLLGIDEGLVVSTPEDDGFVEKLGQQWDLVLVDEELWPNATPPHAVDGASLVACIRAWARKQGILLPGVVILTAEPRSFKDETLSVGAWRPVADSFVDHEAFLGRALDVEWLLTKSDPKLSEKVKDLRNSFRRARVVFGDGGISFKELIEYLDLPNAAPWLALCHRTIREARPPITEGLASDPVPQRGPATVFTWLLQRALAFPGLFVSDNFVATALEIKPEAIDVALATPSQYRDALASCIYKGPLASLTPRRWWAAGIDNFVLLAEDMQSTCLQLLELAAQWSLPHDQVVVYDNTFKEAGLASIDQSVRARPAGWPVEAYQPWMRRPLGDAPEWIRALTELEITDGNK